MLGNLYFDYGFDLSLGLNNSGEIRIIEVLYTSQKGIEINFLTLDKIYYSKYAIKLH